MYFLWPLRQSLPNQSYFFPHGSTTHYSHQYGLCLIFCHFHSFLPTSLTTLLLLFSYVWLFATPRTAACQASLSFTISRSLLKLMSIELVTPFNHLKLCCPLLLRPTIFPSIKVFSNESALHTRWPKYWSFNISPSSEYSGLFPLGLTSLISLKSRELSRVFSNTTVQKHQFFGAQLSL